MVVDYNSFLHQISCQQWGISNQQAVAYGLWLVSARWQSSLILEKHYAHWHHSTRTLFQLNHLRVFAVDGPLAILFSGNTATDR